jgi:hypothetical protein
MTRRDFLTMVFAAGSAAAAGVWIMAKRVLPKRFIWAKPVLKYPGRMKEIEIEAQSKWSG